MKLLSLFTAHPKSVGETYTQHLGAASGFSIGLMAAGAACLMHALLPFLFQKTASRMVDRLHTRMIQARTRHAPPVGATAASILQ